MSIRFKSMLDACPRRDDGTQADESKGEKSQWCDRAAEPKNLAVCDQDNRQILEDGVDGNRQIFESFCTGIDHSDEEYGYWEPCQQRQSLCLLSSSFFPPLPSPFL